MKQRRARDRKRGAQITSIVGTKRREDEGWARANRGVSTASCSGDSTPHYAPVWVRDLCSWRRSDACLAREAECGSHDETTDCYDRGGVHARVRIAARSATAHARTSPRSDARERVRTRAWSHRGPDVPGLRACGAPALGD